MLCGALHGPILEGPLLRERSVRAIRRAASLSHRGASALFPDPSKLVNFGQSS